MERIAETLPPPVAFGAPDKYASWRMYQMEAVLSALNSKERFLVQVQPTGSGKSLCYVMSAVLGGRRVLILTSTKALQDQIMGDFGGAFGIADVRGQGAYQCLEDMNVTVEDGPCHYGYECPLKEGGCYWYDAVRKARNSKLVLSNYAFWMSSARINDSIGKFDVLILDESHDAPEWVMKVASASISEQICKDVGGTLPEGNDPEVWKRWAAGMAGMVEDEAKKMAVQIREHKTAHLVGLAGRLRKYDRALGNVLMVEPGNMVVDRETVGGHVLIEPISAIGLAEKLLFRGVQRVILTSATIRPKTLHIMGVSGVDGMMRVEEYPSQFAVSRRPIIYVPTVRVQHDMSGESERRWVAQIDNIIRQRRDRKGIIHSVSYARARRIAQLSEFRDSMIVHDSWTVGRAIKTFRESGPGSVLVSPSISTGYDFPMDQAEFQVVSKIAFPDSRTSSSKARAKHDREYPYYITMQQIVQACGRATRSAEDQSETFIVDDHWSWLVRAYTRFAPRWFLQACRTSRTIPSPPAALPTAVRERG